LSAEPTKNIAPFAWAQRVLLSATKFSLMHIRHMCGKNELAPTGTIRTHGRQFRGALQKLKSEAFNYDDARTK
jgi:hypothetical protein